MRTSETIIEISKALCAMQGELKNVGKTKTNNEQRYTYASLDDYMEAIKEALTNHQCAIIAGAEEPTRLDPRPTKSGSIQYAVQVKISQRLLHVSGEWIEIESYGDGQDFGDKAIYKAVTGARKYGIACLLGLATSDDPENDDAETKQQKALQQRQAQSDQRNTKFQTKQQTMKSAPPMKAPPPKAATPPAQATTTRKPNLYDLTRFPMPLQSTLSAAFDSLDNATSFENLQEHFARLWKSLSTNTDAAETIKAKYESRKLILLKNAPPPSTNGASGAHA